MLISCFFQTHDVRDTLIVSCVTVAWIRLIYFLAFNKIFHYIKSMRFLLQNFSFVGGSIAAIAITFLVGIVIYMWQISCSVLSYKFRKIPLKMQSFSGIVFVHTYFKFNFRARYKTCKQEITRSMEDETSVTINLYSTFCWLCLEQIKIYFCYKLNRIDQVWLCRFVKHFAIGITWYLSKCKRKWNNIHENVRKSL